MMAAEDLEEDETWEEVPSPEDQGV
jgi:hypothetical protein